jgi:hypothetical protein
MLAVMMCMLPLETYTVNEDMLYRYHSAYLKQSNRLVNTNPYAIKQIFRFQSLYGFDFRIYVHSDGRFSRLR